MMRTLTLLLVGFLLVAFAVCESRESQLNEVFGSQEAIATVESADTVTAQRLVEKSYHRAKSSEYETQGEPVELNADQQARLKKLLLDAGSYDFGVAKGCEADYGVRLRFVDAAGKIVDVLLCFQCDILAVYRDDVDVGGEDFDRVSDELASLMKELFPDDAAIAEL